jgi:putative DNA primase/helicase
MIPEEVCRPMTEVLALFDAEMPGILAWAVRGALVWQQYGLERSNAVKEATNAYKTDQDLVQQFLEESCEIHPDYEVDKAEIYKSWQVWCVDAGEHDAQKRSKKWLTQQLTKREYEHCGAGKSRLKGLKLREEL